MNSLEKKLWSELVSERALLSARKLFGSFHSPQTISKLKVKPSREKAVFTWKMKIPGQTSFEIVAKRGEVEEARFENLLYTTILPRLGLGSLRCFGVVEESDNRFAWLFLEHAGHCRYNPAIPEHVNLAAEWLSILHGSQLELELKDSFRKCGDEHYGASLRKARTLVEGGLINPVLSPSQQEVVHKALHLLDKLEERWPIVEDICSAVPRCLIHGDFLGKNLRVESNGSKYQLKVFDWEAACWGLPFLDLAESLIPTSDGLTPEPDLDSYISSSKCWWPDIEINSLKGLIGLGKIFWSLDCLKGHAEGLQFEWVDNIIENIRIYLHVFEEGLNEVSIL